MCKSTHIVLRGLYQDCNKTPCKGLYAFAQQIRSQRLLLMSKLV